MEFGEGIVAEGGCFFGEAFLCVGYHYSLSDSPQHVVHDNKNLVF